MSGASPAVLLVCLGNICRSPLAEAAFRAEARKAGLDLEIDSAGTADWHVGKPPDPRSVAVAAAAGIDISGLKARQVTEDDFRRFTHIFAMDNQNLADLVAIAPPDAAARVGLLLDMVAFREGASVVDPYYGDAEMFEYTWSAVSEAARAFMELHAHG
ncbi:Low molecular weight protein-tyrosine-phosphatase YfkJ [Tsuneonella dongtanensis]|uniref:protein-tyrosine-phosphatase n=1 Tax=Tsuneonella dongtanensis TaxID=692370 RepID=A0A1B2AFC8_9SPHN|nr:low molecular weight protein-tyrosine-phosphatase [Tsuneonella dongtanensis]ANY20859.1 Low molecular weight protein-tyrosine-phosphatase YfkJ [Tsuneonella dongtanensis]